MSVGGQAPGYSRPICYAGGEVMVQAGDRVTTRVFLFRREAVVVYVPGISEKQAALEHHGLKWVGMQEGSGARLSALVDPDTGKLDRVVRFIGRGTPGRSVEPGAFDEEGEVVDPD